MNFYEILGLNKDADAKQIKKSFRDLSKIHHPDKGGNEEEFKRIVKAYEILSDPKRRKAYDEGRDYESIQSISDKAYNSLFGFIDSAINSFGFVPDHTDLVSIIEGKINESYRKNQNDMESSKKEIRFLEDTKKRVVSGSMIIDFLNNQINSINNRIEGMEEYKLVLEMCLKLTTEWEYKYEEDREPIGIDSDEYWAREYE